MARVIFLLAHIPTMHREHAVVHMHVLVYILLDTDPTAYSSVLCTKSIELYCSIEMHTGCCVAIVYSALRVVVMIM